MQMAKKKKVHLKYGVKKFLAYFIVLLLILIYAINEGKKLHEKDLYEKSYEYKLIQKKYPEAEAKKLAATLTDENLETLTKEKYNEIYYQIVSEKYYLNKNFNKYLTYYDNHPYTELSKIIALVNTRADELWYTKPEKTDVEAGYLMLVNKFNYLEADYERIDLEAFDLSVSYGSYGDNKAAKIVVENYDKMQAEVKRLFDVQIMVTAGYRSYSTQQEMFDAYGEDYVARPGHSEHQTGLGIDIVSPRHPSVQDFFESEEGKWIVENCWQYGFIIRFPEDKEDITGYDNDALHIRYVGQTDAKKMKDEHLSLDEYYAYYVIGDK
jgi:LAS superfamily LD-carboxypeptidase LdcB